ncbi:hypothetical protein SEA_FREGLEY_69 [Microbacterium phage Fregley]|nr:hypothetical protein SEA_FREGLEY_69 [Microbacterium phage Fregley]
MSVADEAKAAAEAEYPLATEVSISVEASVARMRRVPFAHGYQRGYEVGVAAQADAPNAQRVRDILYQALRERGEGAVYSDTLAGYLTRALAAARDEQ